MADMRARGGLSDGGSLDYGQAGPTMLRMLVGAQLRRLREASGISREDAGRSIRGSESKISRLELGRTGFKKRDVADLLTLYGVTDEAERTTLAALAEQANAPGWWHAYNEVVPAWFEPYLGLEQAAGVIRTYEVQFVHGLLQVEEYARAVIRLGHGNVPAAQIEQRVRLRMRRQRIFARPGAPRLWAVLDEAALRRPIGGPATMRTQLRHLIEMARLPNVTVQVMPFSTGGHAAAGGPITILRFPEGEIPDMVYLEQLTSAVYVEKPADVVDYWHVMNRLSLQAADPPESIELLHRILLDI